MKRMKRFIAVTLAACLASVSCVGCSNQSNLSTDSNTAANPDLAPAEISIFQFKVEAKDAFQKAIDIYTAANPQIKINMETVGGGDDYGASLRAKMQSGQEPTIFNIGGPQDVLDWQDKLVDLSDQPWVDQAVDGTLGSVTIDGKVYGMPYAVEGYGIIVNREIFEAAGVDINTMDTYDGMKAGFEQLQSKIDDGSLKSQYPQLEAVTEVPGKEQWVLGLHTSNVAFANEFDSALSAFEADSIDFKYADQLKALLDLETDYTTNANDKSKLNAVDYSSQVGGGIAIERVAAIQQGNWIASEVEQVDPDVLEKLTILPIPLEGVNEGNIPVGVPMYWCVNNDASEAEQAAAKDFLNWLYQSEEGKQIIVNDAKFVPPFKNYEDLEPSDPLSQDVKRYSEDGQTMPWVFMGYPTSWGEKVLGSEIQKYFAGQDWNTTVQNAKNGWASSR